MTGAVLFACLALVLAGGSCVVAIRQHRRADEAEARVESREVELAELTAQHQRLTLALDAMELGVVVVDAAGDTVLRNRAAGKFVGARHGRALVEGAVDEVLTDARKGRSGEREVELVGPPLRAYVVRAEPIGGDDGLRRGGAVALMMETTELRRVDQLRRDFVANISHELRTPIGALVLLAETIRGERESDVVEQLSDRMVVEAERVVETIEDLLELSRTERDDETVSSVTDVRQIVDASVARISAAAEQLGVSIDVSVDDRLRVAGDARQLTSAVFNLIDNAVKFSPAGSVVDVEASSTTLDGAAQVQIAITDRGVGIPARDLDRVFERFYRVDRARSRETGGTGLGLAIVRHVVSNHDGEITVWSREGEGSVFTLHLPSTTRAASDEPTVDERDASEVSS